jgi:type VI secretion system protein ImpI
VALYAFFRGACLPPQDIDEQKATFMLHRLGRLMRELLVGLTDALHFHAEQKKALRIPNTATQPKKSQPKIFSTGVEKALNTLIAESAVEFEATIDATREAFQDMKVHQGAMLGAVRIALLDFIGQFDPDELEQSFDHGTIRSTFLGAANKSQYWNRYRDVFEAMSPPSPGHFPQSFVEELSRAYLDEAARLKEKRQTAKRTPNNVTRLRQAKAG